MPYSVSAYTQPWSRSRILNLESASNDFVSRGFYIHSTGPSLAVLVHTYLLVWASLNNGLYTYAWVGGVSVCIAYLFNVLSS